MNGESVYITLLSMNFLKKLKKTYFECADFDFSPIGLGISFP